MREDQELPRRIWNQYSMTDPDFLHMIPLNWRNLTFWALPALASEGEFVCGADASLHFQRIEVYLEPSYGYYYRLERTSSQPTGPNSGGWRLEALEYGSDTPVATISCIPPLSSATFPELVAALGVLSAEATEPWELKQHSEEWHDLKLRWDHWLRSPAPWIKVDPYSPSFEHWLHPPESSHNSW